MNVKIKKYNEEWSWGKHIFFSFSKNLFSIQSLGVHMYEKLFHHFLNPFNVLAQT